MTSSRRRGSKQPREVRKGPLKKPRPVWFVTLMAFVLPGSGQVFNGAPARGVIFQFGMVMGGFITYQLTTPEISALGRMAGGLLVYVFSIVDANGIAKLRVKAWERIEAGQPPRPRRGMTYEPPVKGSPGGSRKTDATAPGGRKSRRGGRAPAGPAKSGGPEPAPVDRAAPEDASGEPGAPPESASGPEAVRSECARG